MQYNGSVGQMDLRTVGQEDLVLRGIDRLGRRVSLAYSEVTGEIYTYVEHDDGDEVVEIFGRVSSSSVAQEVRAQCPMEATGLTLVEAAARYLNGHRYRSSS